jgi:hypothetical protein
MTAQGTPPSGGQDVTPAPATAPPAKLSPARAWYLAALAILLAGAACVIVGLVTTGGQVNSFQRVALPGSGTVTLNHSSGYVIYYEARGAASGDIPNFNVNIAPASASAAVQGLKPYTADVSYTFGSHEGRAVLALQIASPGRFRLAAPGAPSVAGGSALAVGPTIAGRIVITAVIGSVLILAGIGGAITVAIIRHIRAKRTRPLVPLA